MPASCRSASDPARTLGAVPAGDPTPAGSLTLGQGRTGSTWHRARRCGEQARRPNCGCPHRVLPTTPTGELQCTHGGSKSAPPSLPLRAAFNLPKAGLCLEEANFCGGYPHSSHVGPEGPACSGKAWLRVLRPWPPWGAPHAVASRPHRLAPSLLHLPI